MRYIDLYIILCEIKIFIPAFLSPVAQIDKTGGLKGPSLFETLTGSLVYIEPRPCAISNTLTYYR